MPSTEASSLGHRAGEEGEERPGGTLGKSRPVTEPPAQQWEARKQQRGGLHWGASGCLALPPGTEVPR